jgi:hypothetical protein
MGEKGRISDMEVVKFAIKVWIIRIIEIWFNSLKAFVAQLYQDLIARSKM